MSESRSTDRVRVTRGPTLPLTFHPEGVGEALGEGSSEDLFRILQGNFTS